MLTLINTNRMQPPIAPIGLEYVGSAAQAAGIKVEVLDLCLADDPERMLRDYFASHSPTLVGLSFRNVDDCFWPSCQWFGNELKGIVMTLRSLTSAPLFAGGIGFSLFAARLVDYTGLDFGVHGDGESATIALYRKQPLEKIPGLVWRKDSQLISNAPAWPAPLTGTSRRNLVDNPTYFKRGGQIGFETKRGCNRHCTYCADPVAQGTRIRLRQPAVIADELQALLDQGIDVLHTCDAEFNIPGEHAKAVCRELIARGLGDKIRWYTYLSVVPFDAELAQLMRKAGCVGIDFTTDAACPTMLKAYGQPYTPDDIARAVTLCRQQGIVVMMDMLTGGPSETPETLTETISFMKEIAPGGVGCGLGIRIYPGTRIAQTLMANGPLEDNPNIRRKYDGPIDLFKPTFYISQALGLNPARLVKDLIAGDPRFFEPMEDADSHGGHGDSKDHNYNDNTELTDAIARGERGAYWHVMLRLRRGALH